MLLATACASLGPGDKNFERMAGSTTYGEINGIFPMEKACKLSGNEGAPYCVNQADWNWVGALVGQHGVGLSYRVGLAVPASLGIRKGDIVSFTMGTDADVRPKFRSLEHRKTDGDSSTCGWIGSHFGTGGVVCNGWKWNHDFPPLS